MDKYKMVVTDLTMMRMGRACIAGVELDGNRNLRPVKGTSGLNQNDLEVRGGKIELGCVIEFPAQDIAHALRPPHIEDVHFDSSEAQILFRMSFHEVYEFLLEFEEDNLRDIFGNPLSGSRYILPHMACCSLGTLACSGATARINGNGRLRIDIRTAAGLSASNLPYNDSHLCEYIEEANGESERARRLEEINKRLRADGVKIARVGLSRPFDPGHMGEEYCWLQINAVYTKRDGNGTLE